MVAMATGSDASGPSEASEKQRTLWLVLALLVLLVLALLSRCDRQSLRVASFNIETYPQKGAEQERWAFATLESLDASIVALQEITDPQGFAAQARRQLGPRWEVVFDRVPRAELDPTAPTLHLGLLFDGRRWTRIADWTHAATQLGNPRLRPTVEVQLRGDDDRELRVFVVHFKSGGDHAPTRARQLEALAPLVERARSEGGEVLVLGDFNSTGEPDREALAAFAARTGLDWSSRALACTAYWRPERDGKRRCEGSALDHLFASRPPRTMEAKGPCESVGCEPGDRCPLFYDEVSDHCPILGQW